MKSKKANLKKEVKGPMKMKAGGYLEPDKELMFGGVQKYKKGGNTYPVYEKGSKQSQSFQEAFGKAGRAGKSTFEWEGRKYGTRLKGETDADYETRMRTNAVPEARATIAPPKNNTPSAQERTLISGPRPSLAPAKTSIADKMKERSTERKANRAERQKENKNLKATNSSKNVTSGKTPATPTAATKNASGTGMKSFSKPAPAAPVSKFTKKTGGKKLYKSGGFPDLTGDGKITKADILKGRGVIKKNGGKKPY